MVYKVSDLLIHPFDKRSVFLVTSSMPLVVSRVKYGFEHRVSSHEIRHYINLGNIFELSELEKLFYGC